MRAAAFVLAGLVLAGGALASGAAAQVEPGAPEGARQTAHSQSVFDSFALPVGPFGLDDPAVRQVEGAVARSAWRLDDPEASVAGVMQGYRERLVGMGFEPLFECAGEACGGFDFRFEAEILPPPGMLVDVRDFAQLTANRDQPEGFVSILVSRVLDSVYVQTVSVVPPAHAAPAQAPTAQSPGAPTAPDAPDAESSAEAIGAPPAPETPSETVSLPQDEPALRARLSQDGHVPVQGLDFEVGGATLSPGSAEVIDRLADMLRRDQDLSVAVVGHSDNKGGLELNLALSRRRAEAVMRALVERGVPAARLEARGVGYLAPVASNATEQGRAQNRRVELVLR